MHLSAAQKVTVAVGLLALAISLAWVPYKATYARDGDNYSRDIGYSLVFAAPQNSGCKTAFGARASAGALDIRCTVAVQTPRVVMAAGSIGLVTAAITIMLGLFGSGIKEHRTLEQDENFSGLSAPSSRTISPTAGKAPWGWIKKFFITAAAAVAAMVLILTLAVISNIQREKRREAAKLALIPVMLPSAYPPIGQCFEVEDGQGSIYLYYLKGERAASRTHPDGLNCRKKNSQSVEASRKTEPAPQEITCRVMSYSFMKSGKPANGKMYSCALPNGSRVYTSKLPEKAIVAP